MTKRLMDNYRRVVSGRPEGFPWLNWAVLPGQPLAAPVRCVGGLGGTWVVRLSDLLYLWVAAGHLRA